MRKSPVLIVVSLTCLCSSQDGISGKPAVSSELQNAIEQIRANSLRGDLSFLASDVLEGRNTPSHGLDVAAEYIAAQFRAAGLEEGGDDGYFQTANMAVREMNREGFELKLSGRDKSFAANPKDVEVQYGAALDISESRVFKLDLTDSALVRDLTSEQVHGRVVVTELARGSRGNARVAFQKLREAKPAVILLIEQAQEERPGRRVIDPESERVTTPRILLAGREAARFYGSLKAGLTDAIASIHVAEPHQTPVRLRNVIGILRGSDRELKDSCILLTAHYDHIGKLDDGPGDRIYNGANDDGSGTVSVIEVARALAGLQKRPRRTIIFMTFFGEEEGMTGSYFYARHPAWPIDKTVAQLNLEQVGRTDSNEGPHVSDATLTGFDFSDLADYLRRAGEITGVKLYKDSKNSDRYFRLSDNIPLAEAGVPAHTLAVTFEFPDYHGLGDEWQKIDYENMAKVDRTIAVAVALAADSQEPVRWNEKNSRTAPFVKALGARRR